VHAFILERGMPGLSTGAPFNKLGMRDSPTGEVFMDDVRLEKKHLIGENERKTGGPASTKESLAMERSGITAISWGIIERTYEETVKYAKVARSIWASHRQIPSSAAQNCTHVRSSQECGKHYLSYGLDADEWHSRYQFHQCQQGLH